MGLVTTAGDDLANNFPIDKRGILNADQRRKFLLVLMVFRLIRV